MPPSVQSLDHLVLTVDSIPATCAFYESALGMTPQTFQPLNQPPRWALGFGAQKINLHDAKAPFDPKADRPTPGSADLCFLSETPLETWITHLIALGIPIEDGPTRRTGAQMPLMSIYIRDPDGNLIEISNTVTD